VRVRTQFAIGDAFFVGLSVVTAAAALAVAVRLRRAQLDSLRLRAAQLEVERDQRSKFAAVFERTRIAREMHDILGHNLSVIITLADGGARASTLEARRGTEALRLIGDVGRRALDDLRRVLAVLRELDDAPEQTPQPDIGAISGLCDQIRAAGPLVTYRTSGQIDELDPGLQLTAYRIAQEALTNCLRHAGPSTHIELALHLEPTCLRVTVADTGPANGHMPLPMPPGRHGLIGIRERAATCGGTITAGPDPHGGWVVTALLPRPASTTSTEAAS
jgi:signal transduction histidine kinase